jgi:hypothetical protein
MLMMSGLTRRTAVRAFSAAAVALVSVLGLTTGCGKPEFKYVSNQDEKTYFKVPYDWHEIDSAAVDAGFGSGANPESATAEIERQLTWSAAYDADANPTPEHMTRILTSESPVLYVTIRHQAPFQQDAISFDSMRDFFLPVTQQTRELAEAQGI